MWFDHLNSLGHGYINDLIINDKLTISNSNFKNLQIEKIIDNDNGINFNYLIGEKKECSITFKNIELTGNYKFFNCQMSQFIFEGSYLMNPKFMNCIWEGKNRLLLGDEIMIKKSNNILKTRDLLQLERLYRNLKRIFDSNKDWENSGYAYISEMNFRKKRLWKDNNYSQYFIYWFYGYFGGYTQNFMRPLIIFLTSTLIVFPLIYNITDFLCWL